MKPRLCIAVTTILLIVSAGTCLGRTLEQIREQGVLRHIGVPYANFVTGQDDGLSVELIKRFADHLGVRYEYVPSSWPHVISDLTGHRVKAMGDKAVVGDEVQVRGDLIANGLTVLPWRRQILDFSEPTFPTQVWLVTRADSPLRPITPKNEQADIRATRTLLEHTSLLGKRNTCLDPKIYPFATDNFTTVYFDGVLNDLFPAVLMGKADSTLLDVPDALVAMGLWPGQVKVLGPLSTQQNMGVGFRKDNPELRQAFNKFYVELRRSGEYSKLVQKYYPAVFGYYPDFFSAQ